MDPSYYLADQVHALAAEQRRSRLNAEYLRGLRAALEAIPPDDHGIDLVAVTEHAQDAYKFRARMDREAIERLLEGTKGGEDE